MSTFAFYEIDDDGEPVSDETTFTAAGTLTDPVDRLGIYALFQMLVGSKIDDEAEWLNSRNVTVRDGRSFNLWQEEGER